jgi:S-methylmethionine-dependent homocysteine/selenocysteine methylase
MTTLLLDGGLATELERAGLPVREPWWSSRALLTDAHRLLLRSVHEAYLAAGARVITANTFRTNVRALPRTRLDEAGREWLVHAAVGVAGAARNGAGVPDALVAGSMGPAADCYRPDLVPPDEELRAEHAWLATRLARAGVNLFLIETMNTVREARIALAEVLRLGGRAWVSFTCAAGGLLLSGEPLTGAVRAVTADGAEAVLVNCTPPGHTEAALRALREVWSGPAGAYPNNEDRAGLPAGGHLPALLGPNEFADRVAGWCSEYGLTVAGGCCGTAPAHLAALSGLLHGAALS